MFKLKSTLEFLFPRDGLRNPFGGAEVWEKGETRSSRRKGDEMIQVLCKRLLVSLLGESKL